MRFEEIQKKAGVSLVTVLLFMLVATIAATATYKWLSSEGRSSASRMMQNEAYLSALAGIESARSWMTYNANETGAIIGQYKNGNNAPVKLTDLLAPFMRAGQHFDVYLVGVNTEKSTYKLKLLSEGTSRNGEAKHSEVAILSVNGLYQVTQPGQHHHKPSGFNYAYYGGSFTSTQVTATSAVVNGNWSGNPPNVTGDWIVTGHAVLSGKQANVGENACIAGYLSMENAGIHAGNLYVVENFLGNAKVTGNAYFEKDARLTNASIAGIDENFKIGGNLTVQGKLVTTQNSKPSLVEGNLCIGDDGALVSVGIESKFTVKKNTWITGDVWFSDRTSNDGNKTVNAIKATGCTCNKVRYTCDYRACKCKKMWYGSGPFDTDCEEFGMTQYVEKQCELVEYGECSDADISRSQSVGVDVDGMRRKLVARPKSFHYSGTEACEYGNLNLIGCTGYSLVTGAENYGTIGSGYKYQQIILGDETSSKAYVDNAHSWSDFETLKGIYGDEKTVYVQNGSFPQVYWNKNSGDQKYYPYDPENNKNGNTKTGNDDMYYIAKDLGGKTSVGWGSYYAAHYGTYVYAYFIDYSSMDHSTSYTTSTHTNDDGGHPIAVDVEGNTWYYRYLNGDQNDITGSPYCRKPNNTKKYRPVCGVNPWFKSNGQVLSAPTTKPSDVECGESIKTYCNSKWDKVDGCEGTSYVVPDPLVTGIAEFEPYASKAGSCAATITKMMPQNGLEKSFAYKMNECYRTLTSKEENKKYLYNGFMVVKIAESSQNYNPAEDTVLIGNYIIIVENELLSGQQGLPHVADDRYVFLYLKKGAKYIQKEAKNYFIYTLGDIGNSSKLNLTGSIYAPAASCANARFEDSQLTFSQDVLDAMEGANILCKEEPCGGPVVPMPDGGDGEGDGDDDIEYSGGSPDRYYISVAPQLSVTLESQYKNNESAGNVGGASVKPSFIVLPRIIYLTKDAKGQLSDYYNIVPLNAVKPTDASSPVSGVAVNGCDEISSGTLGGNLAEKIYTCEVQATVNGMPSTTSKVPFWVIVSGTGGSKTAVSFEESSVQLAVGNNTPVRLTWEKTTGAGVSCKAIISVSDHASSWVVNNANDNLETLEGNKYAITFNTSQDPPSTLFNVHNNGANDGGVIFMIERTEEGCAPGEKPVEAIYNTNSVIVHREGLAEYCAGPGSGEAACNAGGEYQQKMNWPECDESGTWVNANHNGISCTQLNENNSWRCDPTGTISLTSAADLAGCQVIIPTTHNSVSEFPTDELGYYEPVTLYGAIKSVPQKLKVEFDVTGDLSNDQSIYIFVDGSLRKTCKYGDFLSDPATCELDVFRNSIVKLSFNSDPEGESVPPSAFNYWMGDGPDFGDAPLIVSAYAFAVSGSNTVVAHFGENDRHCFFDEFKDENHDNRASVVCGESGSGYCIQTCNENGPCGSVANGSAKWRLMEGSLGDIEYNDGRISLNTKATRGKKESEKLSIRTVVMSTAQAGKDGELKAQFQVPEVDAAKATVKNSGFILRSDASKSNFLMLNVFATGGTLKARLCVNGQDDKCHATQTFTKLNSITATDIVMMSAGFAKQDGNDILRVKVWPSSWADDLSADEVTFSLTESSISGVGVTSQNEYVGYSLADPNFKLYGIGWKSYTYNAQCWDAPPSISCSFKAAYAGGIVPLDEHVTPWTGLSAWYNTAHASGCKPVYYYNDSDGGCYGQNLSDDGYKICNPDYQFSTNGAHGYYSDAEKKDVKTAKASVAGCNVTGPAVAWANQGVAAHCGAFWVGKIKQCSKDIIFDKVASGLEGEYYAVDDFGTGVANVRGADLKVFLDNPGNDEVEIYLYSMNTEGSYSYGANKPIYSLPYKTESSGTITISVETISTVDGFDPERVRGVYIKTSGTAKVTSNPRSVCGHVLGIKECTAKYVSTANAWEITTTLTGNANSLSYKHVEKMAVTEKSGFTSELKDEAAWTALSKTVSILDPLPYILGGRTYQFTVALTPDEGDVLSCTTDPETINGYEAVCGNVEGGLTQSQGDGLPVFRYGVKCPKGPCKYSVVLDDGTTIVEQTTTSVDVSKPTPDDAANTTTKPLDIGTYFFKLELEYPTGEHTTDKTSCTSTKSFTVKKDAKPINATCPSEHMGKKFTGSEITVNPGGACNVDGNKCSFTLTESGGGSVSNLSPSNGEYVSGPISFTGASEAGNRSYVLTLSRTDADPETCTFDVDYINPLSVSCGGVSDLPGPSDPDIPERSQVSVSPEASGCYGECSWKVCVGNTTCSDQDALAKQSNVSDGQITAAFTDPNGTGEGKQYNVIVSKDGQSQDCSFKVTYTTASSGSTCNCAKYCGSGCESNIVTGNAGGGNIYSGCVFLTAATRINNNAGYTINGTPITENGNLCYGDEAACASKLAAYEPVDGGWYFKMDNVYTDIISSGYNPCATVTAPTITACPVASATLPPNGTVRITPTTTNCNVLGGCHYTILPGGTGDRQGTYYSGDITFKGESSPGGPVEYTISISNSAGSASLACPFQVTYSASIAATEIPTSGNVPLSAGTHVIKCTSGKVVSCGHYINNDYSTYSMTIDDVSCPVAREINWNRCQDISCTGGNQTLVTDRNITCQAL